jgi:preprotein translocase subunit Sss1
MTREEARVWRKLEEYIKARQTFFKEESQPAWKEWKAAELQMVAKYMVFKRGEKK